MAFLRCVEMQQRNSPQQLNGLFTVQSDADEDGERVVPDGILVETKRSDILYWSEPGRGRAGGRRWCLQSGRVQDEELIVTEDEKALDRRRAAQVRD